MGDQHVRRTAEDPDGRAQLVGGDGEEVGLVLGGLLELALASASAAAAAPLLEQRRVR